MNCGLENVNVVPDAVPEMEAEAEVEAELVPSVLNDPLKLPVTAVPLCCSTSVIVPLDDPPPATLPDQVPATFRPVGAVESREHAATSTAVARTADKQKRRRRVTALFGCFGERTAHGCARQPRADHLG
jgi:hypothetical protein